MVTGLYVESHGIIQNDFYSASTGEVNESLDLLHRENSSILTIPSPKRGMRPSLGGAVNHCG